MARVSSPLYWQLIENFFYTMYVYLKGCSRIDFYNRNYFGHLECAVMVCVSGTLNINKCILYIDNFESVADNVCVSKCAEQNFPCFDYQYENPQAVTFEQAGNLAPLESIAYIFLLRWLLLS